MGKVIHVSDELHAKLHRVCEKEGIGLRELSERVLYKFIEDGKVPPPVPVPQKKLERANAEQRDGSSPWEAPPFWEGGQRVKEDPGQLEEDGPGLKGGVGTGEATANGDDVGVEQNEVVFPFTGG